MYGEKFSMSKILRFSIIILILFCVSCQKYALENNPNQSYLLDNNKKKLIVIGVKNEIQRAEWQDQLIGYGVSNLLSQELFNTGHFSPVENNPEIIERTNDLIKNLWTGQTELYYPENADEIAKSLISDIVAYARLTNFSVSRKRGFAGPFSSSKTKVTIDIEVYLKEQGVGIKKSTGQGSAYTKSLGAFFRVRKGKIYFDKTTVGKATKKAIMNAAKGLEL
jgi:hypothetical protein